jgi:hypothetical protein
MSTALVPGASGSDAIGETKKICRATPPAANILASRDILRGSPQNQPSLAREVLHALFRKSSGMLSILPT